MRPSASLHCHKPLQAAAAVLQRLSNRSLGGFQKPCQDSLNNEAPEITYNLTAGVVILFTTAERVTLSPKCAFERERQ